MEKVYQNIFNYVSKRHALTQMILFINQYFPYITFGIYPCVLIYLWYTKNILWMDALLRPLCAFLFVTIFRKIINRPRPHMTMSITPLVVHKTGESFPSRHALSAMIIALVCFYVSQVLGIFMLIIACLISIGRVLAGVHYISDVLVSVIIAVIFFLIKIF